MNEKSLPSHFESFDLTLEHRGGTAYQIRLVASPDGPRDPDGVAFNWVGTIEDPEGSLQSYGCSLFETVFTDSIAAAFRASVEKVRRRPGVGLRIRLALDKAPLLAQHPWEAMWDPVDRAYLSDRPYLVVVRALECAEGPVALEPREEPVNLLALFAEPHGEQRLAGREEWSRILEALQPMIEDERLTVRKVEPPTLRALGRCADQGACHILHVVAHGAVGAPGQGGVLWLEDDRGEPHEVTGNRLMLALEPSSPLPSLVVLNICHSAASHGKDAYDGLAQTLLRRGVEAVVAMREAISADAAVGFASSLYRELAQGRTVEGAIVVARRQIGLGLHRSELAVPVLYMSRANVRLSGGGSEAPSPEALLGVPEIDADVEVPAAGVPAAGVPAAGVPAAGASDGAAPSVIHALVASQPEPPAAGGSSWRRHRTWLGLLLIIGLGAVGRFAAPWLQPTPVCKAPPGLQDMEFVVVEPGFVPDGESSLSVSEPFCISTKEVTRRDWRTVMGHLDERALWRNEWPVSFVTKEEARGFAAQLEKRHPNYIYRLPTREEWLLAARGGAESRFSFGDDIGLLHKYGNCNNYYEDDCSDGPEIPGSYAPNQLGLYDVHGNVAEWVEAEDPDGRDRDLRLGGSFKNVVDNCAFDQTSWVKPSKYEETGFRIVREIGDLPDEDP